jgi:hypothetical protein
MIEKLRFSIQEYLRRQPESRRQVVRGRLRSLARGVLKVLGVLRFPILTLARISGTDKILGHDYIGAYRRFFSAYRNRKITLLEIGVGGYHVAEGGHSLDLWEAYFQRGTIVAIDIQDKTQHSRGRVHVHQCSQVDRSGLEQLARRYGGFDLIIDDGSHLNEHQIETFGLLFPLLKEDGVYVVEDTQTSYWPAFGGGSVGTPGHAASAVSYFKGLVDGLNYAEYLPSARITPTALQESIRGIYFEHNLIAIVKGDNTLKSNMDIDAQAYELENQAASPAGHLQSPGEPRAR